MAKQWNKLGQKTDRGSAWRRKRIDFPGLGRYNNRVRLRQLTQKKMRGEIRMTYPMTIAGLRRELPLCKVADDFYIGAFIMFGDAEITVACAKELLARAPK